MHNYVPHSSPTRSSSRKRRQDSILFLSLGVLISFLCVGMAGLALYLSGYNPFIFPFHLTATAIAERNAICQALIDKAIQASGNYCGQIGSNNVCYGNTTIKADLNPNVTQRFSQRGDTLPVTDLRRLSASPLDLKNDEWGIAIFKIIANLPRSLPGETVTMVVFGNTTLDNASGNLESFYFSSELGQITCEKVPFDGLVITVPKGSGVRMNVNGAELSLTGNASLKANKNGNMEVSLYSGSGRIVSNGQEQYFGAGEKVHVGLGGENGVQSTTGPSAPEPLTKDELDTACTMTGQYCSSSDVTPVSPGEAQQELGTEITFTPSPIYSLTPSRTPTASATPTSTTFVLPSWTPPWTATPTRTRTPVRTATRTKTPVPTRTKTKTPTRTPTRTNTPTFTATVPSNTPTDTATPTATATPTVPVSCGLISLDPVTNPNPTDLLTNITNSNVATITIASFHADWVKVTPAQKLSKLFLNGGEIWNISDNTPPTDITAEGNWVNNADRTIPGGGARSFVVQFGTALDPGTYQFSITFDVGCPVISTLFTVP